MPDENGITDCEMEALRDALLHAYNYASLRMMMLLRMSRRIEDYTQGVTGWTNMVFEVIVAARESGWDEILIRKSFEYNSGNPVLRRFHDQYFAIRGAGSISQPLLEKIVRPGSPFKDIDQFLKRMQKVRARICRIDIDMMAVGSGFLVGPDVVLTNHHVVEALVQNPTAYASRVTCLFDYYRVAGATAPVGLRASLAAGTKALLASSPPSAHEKQGVSGPVPDISTLDYALLRISERIGDQQFDGEPRGWESLDSNAHQFKQHDPLIIVQHPKGEPLQLAIDTDAILGEYGPARVRYATNTLPGSSGAPCFDLDWKLVALHHSGEAGYKQATANVGIPISQIQKNLEGLGLAGVLD